MIMSLKDVFRLRIYKLSIARLQSDKKRNILSSKGRRCNADGDFIQITRAISYI